MKEERPRRAATAQGVRNHGSLKFCTSVREDLGGGICRNRRPGACEHAPDGEHLGNSLPYPKTLPDLNSDRNKTPPPSSRKTLLSPYCPHCPCQVLPILKGTDKEQLRAGKVWRRKEKRTLPGSGACLIWKLCWWDSTARMFQLDQFKVIRREIFGST